jgi:hypothetical protein
MTHLLLTAFALAAPPNSSPGRWEFRDESSLSGRSLLTFRPVELGDRPIVPLHADDRPGPDARYGLLPVGNVAAGYPLVVWWPGAPGGPQVWIDVDGDGRFAPGERHTLGPQPLAVPLTVSVRSGEDVRRLPRTVLVRRRGADGLSYAVRGYAAGRLRLGDRDYAALLTDGNGDGCFDAAGTDRVWIDLDGDGTFDGLTEQFLLGPPLALDGHKYLLRPDALGTAVEVRERPTEQGTVRLTLPARPGASVTRFSAHLVSDWGELVTMGTADRPLAVPVGRYGVEEVTLQLTDARGRVWSYRFVGARRFDLAVTAGQEAALGVLDGLTLSVKAALPGAGARPGQEFAVTPAVRTLAGLELIHCDTAERGTDDAKMAEADIRLTGPDGATADRTSSSFL